MFLRLTMRVAKIAVMISMISNMTIIPSLFLGLAGLISAYGNNATFGPNNITNQETPHVREYFYAGGHYQDDGTGNHVFVNQMYVERLTPITDNPRPYPLVFIHGQGNTGTVRLHHVIRNFDFCNLTFLIEHSQQARRQLRLVICLSKRWV